MLEWLLAIAAPFAPIGVIAGAIGSILGVIYGIYRLRQAIHHVIDFFRRLLGVTEAAAIDSKESKESTQAGNEALVFLADQLGSKQWMARRNDDMLAALLENLATNRDVLVALRDLPRRVRALEELAAERETEAHKQGAHK
jgi:hypothetical protein